MTSSENVALVFSSVHQTLEAEDLLNSGSWPFVLIPVPPSINQGCGLAIQIACSDQQGVEAYLEQYDILPLKAVRMD
ncbi:hypothetical protein UNSWDHB_1597 [Dehalobacter sp. UNSWDHB]|uniref:DUF3343 domain-containing protein n=1 Tax=unclassified Dehalobacter TaxID=2635733 RepID=UPI00028B05B8|nr:MULTISPECIES: DUF3343 domain-containing protein [unclassified Dehalobacter]AFV02785.1 hypothetical protein DHBDCA_p1759 [Dehalobacter sp. DCA]AFV05770.1 hypothetical protein DCF50_p1768 [Dehalobacter sp. CF]EQB21062.1 hypothetical protein UNSWDHB_1597 [Dehalobacter sp. UNSWDHB]